MAMFDEFAKAMLPIVGSTGREFFRTAAEMLVTSFGADLALLAERADAGWRTLAAFRAGEHVGDRLGGVLDLSSLEARCRGLATGSSDVAWHAASSEPDVLVAVLAGGSFAEPLPTAMRLVAARGAAELTRVRAEELHRVVAEAIGEVVWDWDVASGRIGWTKNLELFGYSGDLGTVDAWAERIHPGDRGRVRDSLAEFLAGRGTTWSMEYRFLRADGTTAFVRNRAIAIRAANGETVRMLGSLTDVTQTKELEQRLILAERMASMGTLAAGVAHEINNPLAYVKGNVEHVLHELRRISGIDPDVVAALEEAREGAERVRHIVQDLRRFSRPLDGAVGPIDVERMVESALAIAGNDIRHRARLVKVMRHPPLVDASEAGVGQVIINLVVNAIHALPEGKAEENELRVETGVDAEGRVFVLVADTGSGIPAEVLGRIFDPFFTTKEVGEGTGLGLSIAHSIVSSLGGEISVDSAPGVGSRFRVTLPPSKQPGATAASFSSAPPTRRLRVLVVDDDPHVASSVKRSLAREHDVEVATSGRDALTMLESDRGFDAVVCDVMMPDVSGIDVFAETARTRPALARRFVFLTGGAFTPRTQEFLDANTQPIVEKPFGADALRRAIVSVAPKAPKE